ncbi:1,4-dihydroxy-2-naphthoate octaprenyltransferase [Clostridium sp. DJ247]|uniref:1,4-dihydroxy-2-naphthoate octaprenyltransferase n=1 Tax=Clostridium sp. DJ247 TaxID=2726188 RepID=UPI0016285C98|nr:1,4-dihydroxy-2-naphthoate octaprenyltransferase [Clostridium sp. DJ247]MBC2582041.1 1,4-dihydroxy-2-naphthoate octaprenyltransferase [Clostridium sp. DJ247]
MTNNKLKIWFRAIRPFSFTASIVPVIIGAILASKETKFHLGYFIVTLLATLFLHASTNLLSDHDDYVNNIDTRDSYGSSGVIVEELLNAKQIKQGGLIFLTLGCLLGLFLTFKKGEVILFLGLIGALAAYFYTGKPLMLKYRGLGAPLVFMIYGPLMVLGSFFVQTQQISSTSILVSIPIGLLTTGILHGNDLRDIYHDKKAGIKTLSIIVGRSNSEKIYFSLILLPYVIILALISFKLISIWSLICLITLPSAFKNIRVIRIAKENTSTLATIDQETAKLHAQFGVMLILSLIISSYIK